MKFASGICLITEDVRKLSEFYQKVLQVKTDINDIHVEIAVGEGGLTIYSKSDSINVMGFNYDKYCGTGLCTFGFIVENVDSEYERLKLLNLDIEFVTTPTTYSWGSRSMHFRDLDGNIVGFIEMKDFG